MRFTVNLEVSDDALAEAYADAHDDVDVDDFQRSLEARLSEVYVGPTDYPVLVMVGHLTRVED